MALYAFGSNSSGQLGIGHVEDTPIPTRCIFDDGDEKKIEKGSISQIATGGNHTLVLLGNGDVYMAGAGAGAGASSSMRFRKMHFNHRRIRIRLVSASWEGSFFVLETGTETTISVLGTGTKGELGLGSSQTHSFSPITIPNFPPLVERDETTTATATTTRKIISIVSGMSHVVTVLDSGQVYGWGASRKGQLGPALKERKIVWSPMLVDCGMSFHATDAACGREFTVVCGRAKGGGRQGRYKGEFMFVVLGSGDNKWGVVSDVSSSLSLSQPSLSTSMSLPPRPAEPLRLPIDVSEGNVSVSASWNGIYVHLPDLRVLAWGRNDRGQLPSARSHLQKKGTEKEEDKGKDGNGDGDRETIPRFKKIAVGSEHGLGLLEDEETVVAFGWGEHGNCGTDTDEQGDVKGMFNVVFPLPRVEEEGADEVKKRVMGIAAGCATSWVITS